MPPSIDRSPGSGRRIISRIASPFSAAKTRHIPEFSVKPDDEHKEYAPGDVVSGHVRLRIAKALRVTHIVVCLHGFVQVYKHPGSPVEGPKLHHANVSTGHAKKAGDSISNGFASLFQDEVVLCGDGRLAEGAYQFNFELQFPDHSLPSSIDFERGTISYMITATLTRPTSMAPVLSHDRKIRFLESIDVSSLEPPKARTITLAPVSKRSRTRIPTQRSTDTSDKGSRIQEAANVPDGLSQREVASISTTLSNARGPASPAPSEISFGSRPSDTRRTSQADDQSQGSPSPSDIGKGSESKSSLANKVISVTVESFVGGCLRGDYIPIKIDISHIKPIRSPSYGVIITLFRQGRVDMRPSIPLGPVEKGKESKSDEYYTKSLTGFGGLSLSGAGYSRVFRRELAQKTCPLFVDPHELTAEINARVRVPDEVEVFPTISTVPGAMINFKYYVEVVVDIQGKLQGHEKGFSGLSNAASTTYPGDAENHNAERSVFNPMGSAIIDTAPIRRDKGVVTFTFEVVIGTKDSERKRGKKKMMEVAVEPDTPQSQPMQPTSVAGPEVYDPNVEWYGSDGYAYPWYDDYYGYHYPQHDYYHPTYAEPPYEPPPPAVPIPQMPDESQMTEKERIQQAEERLLPSQPPGIEPVQNDAAGGATAPDLPDGGSQYVPHSSEQIFPASSSSAPHLPSAPMDEADLHEPSTTVPSYTPQASGSSPAAPTSDDKQELQQQRLQAEASVPPLHEHEVSTDVQASVPSLDELAALPSSNMHDSHADATTPPTDLPRYER